MDTYQTVLSLVENLSLAEKAQLIEVIGAQLHIEIAQMSTAHLSWHEFIELTAGSLADDPIERPPQLPLENR